MRTSKLSNISHATRIRCTSIAAALMLTYLLTACSASKESSLSPNPTSSASTNTPMSTLESSTPSLSPSPTVQPTVSPTLDSVPKAHVNPNASTDPNATLTPIPTVKQPVSVDAFHKVISWYYTKQKKGIVPNFPADIKNYQTTDKVMWVGTGKKIYLTFDTGGPMGDVDKLLKTLKDNEVKASFFLAGYNMKARPDFLRRLVNDGHLVANHTMSHKNLTTLSDEAVKKEVNDYAKMFEDIIGKPLPLYFRFPYGAYSLHLLDLISDMGYTSVFWSTAMKDWVPRANGSEDTYNDIINNLHDGNVILMHQGSEDNINGLDRIIKQIKQEGYDFALVSDRN